MSYSDSALDRYLSAQESRYYAEADNQKDEEDEDDEN